MLTIIKKHNTLFVNFIRKVGLSTIIRGGTDGWLAEPAAAVVALEGIFGVEEEDAPFFLGAMAMQMV